MTSDPTTPDALLRLWIATAGKMDPKYHDKFKMRPELHELVHYERRVLRDAFGQSPKLIEILLAARRLDPDVRKRLNRSRNAASIGNPRSTSSQAAPNSPDVLPLPGDAGSTRRPGKKREHYRTGEEAVLRHIARQHNWWE